MERKICNLCSDHYSCHVVIHSCGHFKVHITVATISPLMSFHQKWNTRHCIVPSLFAVLTRIQQGAKKSAQPASAIALDTTSPLPWLHCSHQVQLWTRIFVKWTEWLNWEQATESSARCLPLLWLKQDGTGQHRAGQDSIAQGRTGQESTAQNRAA